MKNISISKRDQKLLIILAGVIIAILAYFFVYQAYMQKADNVNAQIAERRPRLEELREYERDLPVYEQGIKDIAAESSAELNKYPNDVRSEDMLMYGSSIENELGISVDNMSFGQPEYITSFEAPKITEDGDNALTNITAMRNAMHISCGMDYAQFKNLIDYIYKSRERTTLDSISISYDAGSGGLSGSASMSKFFITEDPYKYEATDIPKVDLGVTDPFGTMSGGNAYGSGGSNPAGTGTSSGSSGGRTN